MFSPAVPFASLGSDIFRVSRDIRYGQYARLVLSFLNQRVRRCRHLDGRPQAPSVWLSKLFDKKHRRSVDVILPIFGRRLTMSCAWLSCLYGEVSEVCVLQGQLDNIPVENWGKPWLKVSQRRRRRAWSLQTFQTFLLPGCHCCPCQYRVCSH